jgi:hypothetical protein
MIILIKVKKKIIKNLQTNLSITNNLTGASAI